MSIPNRLSVLGTTSSTANSYRPQLNGRTSSSLERIVEYISVYKHLYTQCDSPAWTDTRRLLAGWYLMDPQTANNDALLHKKLTAGQQPIKVLKRQRYVRVLASEPHRQLEQGTLLRYRTYLESLFPLSHADLHLIVPTSFPSP